MGKLLSICIPSFNMEKYLSRNLDSFLDSAKLSELELIIVNDGSTDNTLEVAKEYYSKYPNTIVIIDKPNGHYGSCVNAALKVASGEFFRIVDADDWVDTQQLVTFLSKLNGVDSDVVYTRYNNFYEATGLTTLCEDPAEMKWNVSIDLNDITFERYVHMHQITYRTQFLKEIQYRQTEGVCYTDTEYVFIPLSQAKNIYCMDISLYQYYIGRDDQSMSPAVLMKNFSHLQKVLNSILNYGRPNNPNKNYEFLYAYFINVFLGMLIDCLFASKCRNQEWNQEFRTMHKKIVDKGIDVSRHENYTIKGFHWLKWLLNGDSLSIFKLKILFGLIDMRIR